MIVIDTSVTVKWFKPGERYELEALDLGNRIDRAEIVTAANEIVSLEIVRGLWRAQQNEPRLGITSAQIESAFNRMETLLSVGNVLRCFVYEVKTETKDIELKLGMYMADAVHLATAIHIPAKFFVADDHHFRTPAVTNYAAGFGVQVVDLPGLIAGLNASAATGLGA